MDRCRSDQFQFFDHAIKDSIKIEADRTEDRVLPAAVVDHHIAGVVDVIGIVSRAPIHEIGACAAVERIIALKTEQNIVPRKAEHEVDVAVTKYLVVEIVSRQVDPARAARKEFFDIQPIVGERVMPAGIDLVIAAFCARGLDNSVVAVLDEIGIVAAAADQNVDAAAAIKNVVAGTAVQRIIAVVAIYRVVAVAAQNDVIAVQARDAVMAGKPADQVIAQSSHKPVVVKAAVNCRHWIRHKASLRSGQEQA